MNCRKCKSYLSAHVDGELEGKVSRQVVAHLEACSSCRKEEAKIMAVRDLLHGLPRVHPIEAESARIMIRLEEAMRGEGQRMAVPVKRWLPRVSVAAVALIFLAIVAWFATSSGSGRVGERASPEQEDQETAMTMETGEGESDQLISPREQQVTSGQTTEMATTPLPQPRVTISGTDYSPDQILQYTRDLGARLDFYASLWYQPSSQATGEAIAEEKDLHSAREQVISQMMSLAVGQGEDPAFLERALRVVLEANEASQNLIPCFAEKALFKKNPVWIISCSVPEDAHLFADPRITPLVDLAKRGWSGGYQQDLLLLENLLTEISPLPPGSWTGREVQEDLKALLNIIAERSSPAADMKRLDELSSSLIVKLLQGEWNPEGAKGPNLMEILGRRIWVIGAESGVILYRLP